MMLAWSYILGTLRVIALILVSLAAIKYLRS